MKTGIVFDQVVGVVLTHFRTKVARLSQNQAIEGTNIGISSLSRLETGDYSLSMEQLFSLSQRFGVEVIEIVATVEQTCANARINGIFVEFEKKSNTDLLLLSSEAVSSMMIIK